MDPGPVNRAHVRSALRRTLSETPVKGVAAFYHGGPYQTVTDVQGGAISELVNRGYAVVGVNYRGTPGFGTPYLEAGYDGLSHAAVQDGLSLVAVSATATRSRGARTMSGACSPSTSIRPRWSAASSATTQRGSLLD